MKNSRFLVLILVSCFLTKLSNANLVPIPLSIKLTSSKQSVTLNEGIQFNLTFTNQDSRRQAIVLPGFQNKGKKIIYFSFYSVKDNFYTEVARESREINMDSLYFSHVLYKHLAPGDSITIPVFFGDTANYSKHIEAHHIMPKLAEGEYKILAWYNPWDEPLAKNAFNKISDFDKKHKIETNKLNLPENGLQSNYLTLSVTKEKTAKTEWVPTTFCPKKCRLCKMIDKSNWFRVEEIIDDQTYYDGKNDRQYTDSTWLQPHRSIAWLGPNPDAILSSLPSYTSRQIIFKNAKGYHYYFNMQWQIGIVYTTRSKILSRIFKSRKSPIKLSETDFLRLIEFRPY